MKKVPKTVWVVVGLIVAAYATWNIAYPSGTMRYKMTVAVETPEGVKTGSAVREVHFYSEPQFLPDVIPFLSEIKKGEAVAVDLGERGVLFALMSGVTGGDYGSNVVLYAFPPPDEPGNLCCHLNAEAIRYYRSLKTGKATLTPDQYPTFVHFRDLKDPKTVENVLDMQDEGRWHYTVKADHFEEMFGKGVKLKEVTIEVTDEPVTTGINRYLPSFGPETGYMEWFRGLRYGDPREIGPPDFKVGEE